MGPDPPAEVQALAAPDIEVTGWVEDLGPLLDRVMVFVAPLRYGAGMKGKVTESLAAGVPVVTTSVGAEGLRAESGRDLMVADDDAGFVARWWRCIATPSCGRRCLRTVGRWRRGLRRTRLSSASCVECFRGSVRGSPPM